MVYFEQHVVLSPATEALINKAITTFGPILLLLAVSIAFLAASITVLSFLLWKMGLNESKRRNEKKQQ